MSDIIQPSSLFTYVRSRQLEGTYSPDPEIGAWITTACRIGKGWGIVSEQDWPYIKSRTDWPPVEPAGLDDKAKSHRIAGYYRVRNALECGQSIWKYRPVVASFDITAEWHNAPKGAITIPSSSAPIIGGHCVAIDGFDESKGLLYFVNSWGETWGDKGRGSMPYEYFDRYMTEAWVMDLLGKPPPHQETDQIQYLNWGISTALGTMMHGMEVYHQPSDSRMGWAFCIQKSDVLEVEEFFVRPEHRGKGYGKTLAEMILELRDLKKLPVRLWVPHPDATPANLPFLQKFLPRLGVALSPSKFRWAAWVGDSGSSLPATTPVQPPVKPQQWFREKGNE